MKIKKLEVETLILTRPEATPEEIPTACVLYSKEATVPGGADDLGIVGDDISPVAGPVRVALLTHLADLANPHAVTLPQAAAASPAGATPLPIVADVAIPAITVTTSTATCTGLNADKLDGHDWSEVPALTGAVKLGGDGASHYVGIAAADGHVTLVGNAVAFDDLRVAGEHVKAGATAPTWGALTGGLKLWFFGAGTEDEVHFSIQMPHNWKVGTAVSPHVHWVTAVDSDEDPADQAIRWGLEYTWANIDSLFPATNTIYAVTDQTIVAYTHYITYFADITPGADQDEMSSMLVCRLFRNGGNGADTFESSAALLEFDLHYQIDSFGSNTASSKT